MRNKLILNVFVIAVVCMIGCTDPADTNETDNNEIAPSAPVITSIVPGSGEVTLAWSSVSDATSYNLYTALGAAVAKATGVKFESVNSPTTITGLSNGSEYAFIVTAINE